MKDPYNNWESVKYFI